LSPRAGFDSVLGAARRREQSGARPIEGFAPYVLAALGGSSFMLLWLKIGALAGLREVARVEFRWSYLVVAAVAGALLALSAQLVWSHIGAATVRGLGGEVPARHLRIVWGASAFPQVFALVLLLPLDLLIVGPDTFTSERLTDPLATGWAAISIALAVSLTVWSGYIFVRGIERAGSIPIPRAVVAAVSAVVVLAAVVAASAVAASALGGSS
jgi:hypothetical protein